jgi:hypothetical protein
MMPMRTFTKENPAKDILILLKHLESKDDGNYSYRGQLRDYSSLLPSYYRSITTSEYFRGNYRLISRRLTVATQTRWDQERESAMSGMIELFGYGIGNLLAQQYGLKSETIDITDNPKVAAFFATRQFPTYKHIEKFGEYLGVIYRWRNPYGQNGLPPEKVRLFEEVANVEEMSGPLWVRKPQRVEWISREDRERLREYRQKHEESFLISVPCLFCSGRDTLAVLDMLQKEAKVELNKGSYSPYRYFLNFEKSR